MLSLRHPDLTHCPPNHLLERTVLLARRPLDCGVRTERRDNAQGWARPMSSDSRRHQPTLFARPGCPSATQVPAPGTKSMFSSRVQVLRMSSNAPGYVPQMTSHRACWFDAGTRAVEAREALTPRDDGGPNGSSATTSSEPHGSGRSSIAERHEVLVVLVATERREHEGAGAAPDTGHRSLGNAFPWRYLRVVRRPRERVLRRACDKAAAVHWPAAPEEIQRLTRTGRRTGASRNGSICRMSETRI